MTLHTALLCLEEFSVEVHGTALHLTWTHGHASSWQLEADHLLPLGHRLLQVEKERSRGIHILSLEEAGPDEGPLDSLLQEAAQLQPFLS